MPKLIISDYTVLLLVPDYVATEFGHETYLAHVAADTPAKALVKAQWLAANAIHDVGPDDFHVLFMCRGHADDIKDRALHCAAINKEKLCANKK